MTAGLGEAGEQKWRLGFCDPGVRVQIGNGGPLGGDGMGQGERAKLSHIGDDYGDKALVGEWSLLVVPAVLSSVSLFVAILATVESRLFE